MQSLEKRVVWITGAGGDIGRAIAVDFAAAGATVALTGRNEDALAETKSRLGGVAMVCAADVSDPSSVTAAFHSICENLGPVDILVNGAGMNTPRRHLRDLTTEDFASIVDVNLNGAVLCSMKVLPQMRARGSGTIIHIASMAAIMVFPPAGASYAAAKAAVRQFSAHINVEEGIHGIRSVAINPGEVDTRILKDRPQPIPEAKRALMLHAEDVAAAVIFAASLPSRATIADLTIVPTDNSAWR